MASKSSLEDFEEQLKDVLEKCDLQSKLFTGRDARNPSSVAHLMGPDVRLGRNLDLVRYFSLWFILI